MTTTYLRKLLALLALLPLLAPAQVATHISDLDESLVYTLAVPRATIVATSANATQLTTDRVSGVTIDATNPLQQFRVELPYPGGSEIFLYHIGTGKYVYKNGTNAALEAQRAENHEWMLEENNGRLMLRDKLSNAHWNVDGRHQITIDAWSTSDDGNRFAFTAVGRRYTVSITGAAGGVSYTGTALVGTTQQRAQADGGQYIFNTTATPTPADFTATPVADLTATVTVSNSAHTITVAYTAQPISYTDITSLSQITDATGAYRLAAGFTDDGASPAVATFTGRLDGNFHTLANRTTPLFQQINGATVCNLVFDHIAISESNHVGAVAKEAHGATRIYNIGVNGGTIESTSDNATGSIVGLIDGTTRVINCYSYADITDGGVCGGIVGRNAAAGSTATALTTMVMNCMFYGNITGNVREAWPVYGGNNISNTTNNGLNTYNYFRHEATIASLATTHRYNSALEAEERFLTRFEFYRGILNSNRALCSYYIFGNTAHADDFAKWVLEPGQQNAARTAALPYPVLRPRRDAAGNVIRYASVTNREEYAPAGVFTSETPVSTTATKLGELSVAIAGYGTISLPVTDTDPAVHDFCYRKVQLPYYNQYFDNNYTNGVVTGWRVTATGGTHNVITTVQPATSADFNSDLYQNYADRLSTNKDADRVFAQGGFYNVPDGVTSITLTPVWATHVVFLCGERLDYPQYGESAIARADCLTPTPSVVAGRTIYHTLTAALNALATGAHGTNPWDNAVVLVGNYVSRHVNDNDNDNDRWAWQGVPFSIMSIDADRDNEPDFCLLHYHKERKSINPVRFDFLCTPGLGMAVKPTDISGRNFDMLNQGIWRPNGWFEITETCTARYTEFEFDHPGRAAAPIILNGGVFEEFVSSPYNGTVSGNTSYMILGGRAWFKLFSPGCHTDNNVDTPHFPINVLGGEYAEFYLSGMKPRMNASTRLTRCYATGAYFHTFAAANQEGVAGDVRLIFDHTRFDECYGGGINGAVSATDGQGNNTGDGFVMGNIHTTLTDCHVATRFCGGPMFGDMQPGKTVTTDATRTTFAQYFGAGFGGTSITKDKVYDDTGLNSDQYVYPPKANLNNQRYNFATYFSGHRLNGHGYTFRQGTNNKSYTVGSADGWLVRYETPFFSWAGGGGLVARFYQYWAGLSLASVRDVRSTLTDCTILGDFYGGGCLGSVQGAIASTLTGCAVRGNVFGAGYSADVPNVEVYPATEPSAADTQAQLVYPGYNKYTGVFTGLKIDPATVKSLKWSNDPAAAESAGTLYTPTPLTGLGKVTGAVALTLDGATTVDHNVYGGGNQSPTEGTVSLRILGATTVNGSVYGGGNESPVTGTVSVQVGEECLTGGGGLPPAGQ